MESSANPDQKRQDFLNALTALGFVDIDRQPGDSGARRDVFMWHRDWPATRDVFIRAKAVNTDATRVVSYDTIARFPGSLREFALDHVIGVMFDIRSAIDAQHKRYLEWDWHDKNK